MTYHGQQYSWSQCHSGNNPILKLGDGTLYAGGKSRGADYRKDNLMVIDLTGSTYDISSDIEAINQIASAGFPTLMQSLYKPEQSKTGILHFYIPDMKIPRFHTKYWDFLVKDVQNLLLGGKDVLIMCQGGHGRTGIAVSIVAHKIAPHLTKNDPITWLRKIYCEKVVETQEQIQYVYDVLELGAVPDGLKPAKLPYSFIQPKYLKGNQGGVTQQTPKDNFSWWDHYLRANGW